MFRLTKSITRLALYSTGFLVLLFILLRTGSFTIEPIASSQYIAHESIDEVITGITLKRCTLLSQCSMGKGWRLLPKRLDWDSRGKKASWFSRQHLFIKTRPLTDVVGVDAVTKLEVRPDGAVIHQVEQFDPDRSNRFYYGIDVVFNEPIDPRQDWNIATTPINGIRGDIPVFLTWRTTPGFTQQQQPVLEVSASGSFKILQLADLHFSSFDGICRDQYPEVQNCKADNRTLVFINKVLDLEKPDLVVLTGDQIFGEDSFDSVTTTLKFVQPLIERKIPYAIMFGNHDDEGSLSRQELMSLMKTLPFSMATEGPQDIDGVGNYILHVLGKKGSLINLYILDSHKYSQSPKVLPGYDWLKESQIEWLKRNKPSYPETGESPINMAFFHIPLPEYRNTNQGFVGNFKEGITAPKYNTNARDALQEMGISVVSVGHDHCNDFCLMDGPSDDNKLWLCYGGGVGEGGYGGYGGTTRRVRLFEIDTNEGKVTSYKRLETAPEETFDLQVLVNGGKPVNM